MSYRQGLKSVCKRMAPRCESTEEEEEWAKKGPPSYLQISEEEEDNLSPRYWSSNARQKKNHKRQGQENQTRVEIVIVSSFFSWMKPVNKLWDWSGMSQCAGFGWDFLHSS